MPSKKLLVLALSTMFLSAGCGLVGAGRDSGAEAYPDHQIRLLVPFAAGGITDLTARRLAASMEKRLGQPIIVENRTAAGGSEAYRTMSAAKPDGYTLSMLSLPYAVIQSTKADVGYSTEQIQPIGFALRNPSVMVVPDNSPYRTAKDFFAAAAAAPGKLSIGTAGAQVSIHLELERLVDDYNVPVKPVPFQGQAPVTTSVLGGNVNAAFIDASKETLALITSGKLRALAVSSPERAVYLPDVPTLKELGYQKLTLSVSLTGPAGPKGMPQPVVDKLDSALQQALKEPDVVAALGENYVPNPPIGPAEATRTVDSLRDTYRTILRK